LGFGCREGERSATWSKSEEGVGVWVRQTCFRSEERDGVGVMGGCERIDVVEMLEVGAV
jgi:hypothetical protein